ncbi:hypothetical protein POTOM_044908 [Populus tomentosa]|uniref:PCI domain-containing protein n=1 Tax=Populus tomentosa TaxID=118781 RepID=A0A8X7YSN2_POPTO|nr:hypothetical protein POTOM_044908 [Populus tomentosa]
MAKQKLRLTEFKLLCVDDTHRAFQFWTKGTRPDLSAPESLQLYLDTRFEQLKVATELELWQEAFRSIEDIHGLMCMVKKTPKASLMVVYYAKLTEIFWISSMAPYDHTYGASHLELENEKERNLRMANLIGFNLDLKPESREVLSRSSLLSELVSKASSLPEVHLSQYVPALEKLVTLRLLQQVSQVYQMMKIESLSQMIPFFDFFTVEKISVDAVKHNFIAMKVDHMKHVVLFGTPNSTSELLTLLPNLSPLCITSFVGIKYIVLASWLFASIDSVQGVCPAFTLGEIVDKEHKRLLARKSIIEKRKEEQERQLLEMAGHRTLPQYSLQMVVYYGFSFLIYQFCLLGTRGESRRLKQLKITEEAEQKRLAAEYEPKGTSKGSSGIEERELEEAQALLEEQEKRSKRKGGRSPS